MKCLITGAGGFIGSHLVEFLLARNQSVMALGHRPSAFLAALRGDLEIIQGDLLDNSFLNSLLERYEPEVIFHLAAQSLPQVAWQEPARTFQVNLTGSLKLFEAVRRLRALPLIVAVSSSSVYAPNQAGGPLNEDAPLEPGSIYAASKLAVEELAKVYGNANGSKIIRVRPFFLIGPRKEGDVSSDFARGIARLERGEASELRVGNLTIVRDLLDVRDGVAALWQVAARGKPSAVYNICSGSGYSIGDLLAVFKKNARVPVRETIEPAKIRPIDNPVIIGDPARLMALGWKPQFDLDSSVCSILNYWRGIS